MAALSRDEEVVEAAQFEVSPAVGEVRGSLQVEYECEVIVVVFVALARLAEEAKPDSPLVQEHLTSKH